MGVSSQSIHLICCSWGVKKLRLSLSDLGVSVIGFDYMNILERAAQGGLSGIPGPADLLQRCVWMTKDENRVEAGFLKLSEKLQRALFVKYVMALVPRKDGADWTNKKLAEYYLEVPEKTFTWRVDEAKRKIKESEF